jgi:uncharacterized protein
MDKLEFKATLSIDEAGTISGIAWPFGSADSVGDLIQKGAFNVAVTDLPMLLGHNPDDLIGTWDEIKETDEGLHVKGRLHLSESARARAVRGLVQGRLISGLSIGFKTKTSTRQGNNRIISALDLFEVSLVRNPSHPRARVISAKSADSVQAIAAAINRAAAALTRTTK